MALESWEQDEFFTSRGDVEDDFAPPSFSAVTPPSASRSRNQGRGVRGGRGRRGSGRGSGRGGRRRISSSSPPSSTFDDGHTGDEFSPPQQQRTAGPARATKAYYPKYKSGPFAILAQLLLFDYPAHKETIIADGQRFCTMAFEEHGVARSHKDRYGAWAGMATLEQKNLVRRNRSGRKPTFSLTETGRELAQRIVEEHGITADGDCHERNPTPSSGSLAPAPRQPTGIGSGRSDSSGNTVQPNPYASLASQKPVSGDALSPVLGVRSMVMSGRGGGNGSSREHAARAAEARKVSAAVGSAAAGQGGANSTTASKTAGSGGERAVGTKRGRQFVERGKERYAKRQQLYGIGIPSPSPTRASIDHGDTGSSGSLLGRMLSLAGNDAAAEKNTAEDLAGGDSYDWGALLTRAISDGDDASASHNDHAKATGTGSRVTAVGSYSPPRYPSTKLESEARATTWPRAREGLRNDRGKTRDSPQVRVPPPRTSMAVRRTPSDMAGTAVGYDNIRRKRGGWSATTINSQQSVDRTNAQGGAVAPDVVDICSSDDDVEDGGVGGLGVGADHVSTPVVAPAAAVQDCTGAASGRVVSHFATGSTRGGGNDGGRGERAAVCRGGVITGAEERRASTGDDDRGGIEGKPDMAPIPPVRNVVSWRSATHYRSLSRAGASNTDGGLDWSDRICPTWLRHELATGTILESDRMIDVFDLVLMVDNKEPKDLVTCIWSHAGVARDNLRRRTPFATLPSTCVGLEVHLTELQVGDYAWAWRRRRPGLCGQGIGKGKPSEVLVVDCIAERKKDEDIVGSIEGQEQRYKSQKRRLRLSGLKRLIYLLEGDLQTHKKRTTGEDRSKTIRTVEAESQAEGFVVKRTVDQEGTVAFLLSLSCQLLTSQGLETVGAFSCQPSRPKISFAEFSEALKPYVFEPQTVSHMFAKCICTVKGVGAATALAVARQFPTPRIYRHALHGCASAEDEVGLVKNLKLAEGGKTNNVQRVGNAVSGKLASLFSARKEGKGGGGGAERGINSVNVGDENGDGKSDGSSASY